MSQDSGHIPAPLAPGDKTEPTPVVVGRARTDSQIPTIVVSAGAPDPTRRAPDVRQQTSDPFSLRGERPPLVGRDSELAKMRRAVADCAAMSTPQLLTVVGNQGTGKSRLVDELLQGLPSQTLVYRCEAAQGGPRYSTIARLLRDRFAISESASEAELIEEFRREVQEVFGDQRVAEVLHVLGRFLDLRFPDSPFLRVLNEDPQQYEEISRTVLMRFIEVDARKGPIVLVVDDLQWADAGTLSLLQEISAGISSVPVTMVVCARPDLMVHLSGWGDDVAHHLRVDLRNLEPGAAEEMFRGLLSRCDQVPLDIVDEAVEMTGGNPHFMDQLVRLFLANGTIDAAGKSWKISVDKALNTDLPITVEEAIEARIASLGSAERDVLEKGAVFGNVFWIGSVVALTRIGQAQKSDAPEISSPAGPLDYNWSEAGEQIRRSVASVVTALVERDYLLRLDDEDSTVLGDVELVFKHNLERELIAKSTDGVKLGRYHRLAAQWIETKISARSEEQLEFLGQLYEKGGDRRRAAYSYVTGGDRARERYANEQAVELYRKGLALLEEDDAVIFLEAMHNLGSVLDLVGDTRAAQLQFSRMLRQAWLFDHRSKGGAAHNRLGRIHRRLGEYDQAMAHLRSAHELFKAADDKRGIAGTLDDIGQVHWLRGAYAQALEFHRQALAIRRGIGDKRSIALSLANIGRVHHETGAFKAASRQFHEALDLRREIADRPGVVQSLCDLGRAHAAEGLYDKAMDMFKEANATAVAVGDKLAQTEVLVGLGECQSAMGMPSDAIESLLEGKAIAHSLGNKPGASACHRQLAETYLSVGDGAQAFDNAQRALELGQTVGSRLHVGTAHRVLAEAVFNVGRSPEDLERADEHFRKAVEILAGMKNELELARTYRAYAIHREHTGNLEEAEKLRRRSDEIFSRVRGASEPG